MKSTTWFVTTTASPNLRVKRHSLAEIQKKRSSLRGAARRGARGSGSGGGRPQRRGWHEGCHGRSGRCDRRGRGKGGKGWRRGRSGRGGGGGVPQNGGVGGEVLAFYTGEAAGDGGGRWVPHLPMKVKVKKGKEKK
ncbi:hypothetical protein Fmac_029767 [Flemingia macrophylla]|uniref:Uncharacterized protein n=1 Tax=Flemingia macrophylla TaxID=520843 RepID=A0ABD1LBK5_9FABA